MASEAAPQSQGTFECELCGLTAPYSYYGQKPPNTDLITLLEDGFVMKDPFTADQGRILVLGALCSLCRRRVCVGPECSLFYAKRFCLPCLKLHLDEFPVEIKEDLEKKACSTDTSSRKRDSKDFKKNKTVLIRRVLQNNLKRCLFNLWQKNYMTSLTIRP